METVLSFQENKLLIIRLNPGLSGRAGSPAPHFDHLARNQPYSQLPSWWRCGDSSIELSSCVRYPLDRALRRTSKTMMMMIMRMMKWNENESMEGHAHRAEPRFILCFSYQLLLRNTTIRSRIRPRTRLLPSIICGLVCSHRPQSPSLVTLEEGKLVLRYAIACECPFEFVGANTDEVMSLSPLGWLAPGFLWTTLLEICHNYFRESSDGYEISLSFMKC